jgi:hypothetical protein
MGSRNDISGASDYDETTETRIENAESNRDDVGGTSQDEPTVLVELVAVDGPEGRKLHAIQGEVILRILSRLAAQQRKTPQKESRP